MNIWLESINLSNFSQKVLTAAAVFVTLCRNLQRNPLLMLLKQLKSRLLHTLACRASADLKSVLC